MRAQRTDHVAPRSGKDAGARHPTRNVRRGPRSRPRRIRPSAGTHATWRHRRAYVPSPPLRARTRWALRGWAPAEGRPRGGRALWHGAASPPPADPVRLLEHGHRWGVDDPRDELHAERKRGLGEQGGIVDRRAMAAASSQALRAPSCGPTRASASPSKTNAAARSRSCRRNERHRSSAAERIAPRPRRPARRAPVAPRESILRALAPGQRLLRPRADAAQSRRALLRCARSFESGRHPSVELARSSAGRSR